MNVDGIVEPSGRRSTRPGWAKLAVGPGGVVSDAEGRVLQNVLQQDLDRPPDPPAAQPRPWSGRRQE